MGSEVLINSTGTGTLGRVVALRGLPAGVPWFADSHVTLMRADEHRAYPPFLGYVLGLPSFARYAEVALSVGSTKQRELNVEMVRRHHVPAPSSELQRTIADFLDREVMRVAAAGAAARRGVALIAEQRDDVFERLTVDSNRVALRFRLDRIEQGWSPECDAYQADPGEWGVLKVGCVNYGSFRATEHKRLPDGVQPRPHLEVHSGDVLMSRANTRELVGSAVVVTSTHGRRLMLCDLLYRLSPGAGIRSLFLAQALQSRSAREQIETMAAGAAGSMPKISHRTIRELRIPDLGLAAQTQIETTVASRSAILERSSSQFHALESRLTEYRDALITEAVTGQLDVTKMSEAQMDERAHAAAEGAVAG